MTTITYLVWQDNDKKYPAHLKLADAIARHIEKHGITPNVCLTSEQDAAALAGTDHGIQIEGRRWVPRNCYYVGVMGTAQVVAKEPMQGVLL